MAQFRWAHINCPEEITVGGPTGSVQFLSAHKTLSGSQNLIFNGICHHANSCQNRT